MENLRFNQEVESLFLKGGSLVKTCISSDEGFLVGVVKMPKDSLVEDIIFKSKRKFEYVIISNYKNSYFDNNGELVYSKIEICSLHNGNLRRIKNLCVEQYDEDIVCYRKRAESKKYIW